MHAEKCSRSRNAPTRASQPRARDCRLIPPRACEAPRRVRHDGRGDVPGRTGYIAGPESTTSTQADPEALVSANVTLDTRTPDETVIAPVGAAASRRPFRRAALIVCGTLSLGLGILGIFVPLLPTTCFLLVAAWCYARSSSRLYDWLMQARWIGPYLRRYRDERSIPPHVKTASLVMMWITIGYSIYAFPNLLIRAALLLTAIGVTWHLYRLPTAK